MLAPLVKWTSLLGNSPVRRPRHQTRGHLATATAQFKYELACALRTRVGQHIQRHLHPPHPCRPARFRSADHFTIAIERASGPRTIDGWLQGDDSILLQLR